MKSLRKKREERANLFKKKRKEKYQREDQEWLNKAKAYNASKCIGGGCGCRHDFCPHRHLVAMRDFPKKENPKKADRARGKAIRKKRTGRRK